MSKKKYTAIIFDMDGTIVDTERMWQNASLELLRRHEVSCPEKMFDIIHPKICGLSIHKSCKIIKDIAKLPVSLETIIEQKKEIAYASYEKHIASKDGVRFIPGFVEFHAYIKKCGFINGVATNADDRIVALTDKAVHLRKFFGEHLYDIGCVDHVCKPDPAIYLYAARKLDVNPITCIAIEDSAHGIAAAKKAGMYCIGINSAKNRKAIKQADYIADTYCDITEHVQNLVGI